MHCFLSLRTLLAGWFVISVACPLFPATAEEDTAQPTFREKADARYDAGAYDAALRLYQEHLFDHPESWNDPEFLWRYGHSIIKGDFDWYSDFRLLSYEVEDAADLLECIGRLLKDYKEPLAKARGYRLLWKLSADDEGLYEILLTGRFKWFYEEFDRGERLTLDMFSDSEFVELKSFRRGAWIDYFWRADKWYSKCDGEQARKEHLSFFLDGVEAFEKRPDERFNYVILHERIMELTSDAQILLRVKHQLAKWHFAHRVPEWRTEASEEDYANERRHLEHGVRLCHEILLENPPEKIAADVYYELAGYHEHLGNYIEAVKLYPKVWETCSSCEHLVDAAHAAFSKHVTPGMILSNEDKYLPDEPVILKVETLNHKTVHFELKSFDLYSWIEENFGNDLSSWAPLDAETVAEWSVETGDEGDHKQRNLSVEIPVEGNGVYSLIARGDKSEEKIGKYFVVSDMYLVLQAHAGGVDVWCVDAKTGKSVAGASLLIHIQEYSIKPDEVYTPKEYFITGKTNRNGLYQWRSKEGDELPPRGYAIVAARHNEQIAVSMVDLWIGTEWAKKRNAVTYLYTDRPLYRPGQEVHFRGIRREAQRDMYFLPKDEHVKVRTTGPDDETINELSMPLSSLGTFSGSFSLADDAKLGSYTLYSEGDEVEFNVEAFRRPEFRVTVEPGQASYDSGDTIKAVVQANYFFGGSVSHGRVHYTVHRFFGRDGWEQEELPYEWLQERTAEYSRWGYDYRFEGIQGDDFLDESGKLEIKIPTHDVRKEAHNYIYSINANVTDASRRSETGSTIISVYHSLPKIHINLKQRFYPAEAAVEIGISLANGRGEDLKGDVVLRLFQLELDEEEKLELDKEEEKASRTLVEEKSLSVKNGSASCSWNDLADGSYILSAVLKGDESDNAEEKDFSVGEQNLAPIHKAKFTISSDKDVYTVGETAYLDVNTPYKGLDLWLTVVKGGHVLEQQFTRMDSQTLKLSLPMRAEYANSINVYVYAVRENEFMSDALWMDVVDLARILDVQAEALQKTCRPGENAEFLISTSDYQGKSVSAEVSLGVVDSSLYEILGEQARDIRRFFFGESHYWAFDPTNQETSYWRSWWNYLPLEIPDVELVDNDRLITVQGARRPITVADVVSQSFDLEVERYDDEEAAELEGEIAPFLPHHRRSIKDGKIIFTPTVGKKAASPESYIIPQLRKRFLETAFWAPDVVTDEEGKAELSFAWPDNLSQWRATARGVAKNTTVGQALSEAQTTLPVVSRLEAPRFLISGDRSTVSVIGHNYLSEPKATILHLVTKGLKLSGDNAFKFDLEPYGGKRADFQVDAQTNGMATLQAYALTDEQSDAMQMSLPVLHRAVEDVDAGAGFVPKEDGVTITLTPPAKRLPGQTALDVEISAGVEQALVPALNYLIQYPWACAEQTTSRYFPLLEALAMMPEIEMHIKDGQRAKSIVEGCIRRILSMRNPGRMGWGWWPHGTPDVEMTSYVLWALETLEARRKAESIPFEIKELRENNLVYPREYLSRELEDYLDSESAALTDEQAAWAAFALSFSEIPEDILELLVESLGNGSSLDNGSRSAWGMALLRIGEPELAERVSGLLEETVVRDEHGNWAYWPGAGGARPSGLWADSEVEATALALLFFLKGFPDSPLIEESVKWLLMSRQGTHWASTRDTALAVLSLSEYLKTHAEGVSQGTAYVYWNGDLVKELPLAPQSLARQNVTLGDADIGDEGVFHVKFEGRGRPLYTYQLHSLVPAEDLPSLSKGGLRIKRTYWKLKMGKHKGRWQTQRSAIQYEEAIKSGERVEVELELESDTDLFFLVVEDFKAAGLEPIERLSAGEWLPDLGYVHREFYNEKTVFFMRNLPRGRHFLRYTMAAEQPGEYFALPAAAHAMYAPQIRARSEGRTVIVRGE
jgi:uncharacterized protein YfaS (alpha-2-macroglobulin family)